MNSSPSLKEIRTELRPRLIYDYRTSLSKLTETDPGRVAIRKSFNTAFDAFMKIEAEAKETTGGDWSKESYTPKANTARNRPDHLVKNVPVYFTPSGCFFIHGPDSLLEAALLASELLYPDEFITSLPVVEWPQMGFEQLEIGVCIEGSEAGKNFPDKRCCHMCGCFITSYNRKIFFYAKLLHGVLVGRWKTFNPFLLKALFPVKRIASASGNGWSYQLHPFALEDAFSDRQKNIFALHLTFDILGAVSPWVELDKPYRFLSRKLQFVQILPLAELINGPQLTINYNTQSILPSRKAGFFRLPYQCSFSPENSQNWCDGELIFTPLSVADILSVT